MTQNQTWTEKTEKRFSYKELILSIAVIKSIKVSKGKGQESWSLACRAILSLLWDSLCSYYHYCFWDQLPACMQALSTSLLSLLPFALVVAPWNFSHGLRVSWTFFLKLGIFYFLPHVFKSCELSLFRDSSSIFFVPYYQTKVNFYSHCVKTACAAPFPNVHTT